MTRLTTLLVAAALAVVCVACAQPAQDNAPADLEAIAAVRNGVVAAFNAGDAEALGSLYTDDAIAQTNQQATTRSRAAFIEAQKAFFSQFAVRMTVTPDQTQAAGTLAYENGTFAMTLTPKAGGDPIMNDGRYTVVLKKATDGTWRIALDMDNTATPPPPPAVPAATDAQAR